MSVLEVALTLVLILVVFSILFAIVRYIPLPAEMKWIGPVVCLLLLLFVIVAVFFGGVGGLRLRG